MKRNNIGFGIITPEESCTDKSCPFHGNLKIRGTSFVGIVTSDKRQNTVTVMWEGKKFVQKYERYKKTRSKISAHNPPCINAEEGDKVQIFECRKISKTVDFVVVKKFGKDKAYFLEKDSEEMQKEIEGKSKKIQSDKKEKKAVEKAKETEEIVEKEEVTENVEEESDSVDEDESEDEAEDETEDVIEPVSANPIEQSADENTDEKQEAN
jgi:small subunit ribosomal protein S17